MFGNQCDPKDKLAHTGHSVKPPSPNNSALEPTRIPAYTSAVRNHLTWLRAIRICLIPMPPAFFGLPA